jgi:ABC-type Na+ efflux pump permease subunit
VADVLKKIAEVVGTVAPLLGTVIGGPLGTAAGAGLGLLAQSIGGDPAKPEEILQKLTTDPATLVKLKEIELSNLLELRKLAFQQVQAELADVQDARRREVEVVKATGKKDINLYVLAWVFISGFFVLTGGMYFYPIPAESIGPINQLFGALVGGVSMVLGYFFGSSRGSAQKTELLANRKT